MLWTLFLPILCFIVSVLCIIFIFIFIQIIIIKWVLVSIVFYIHFFELQFLYKGWYFTIIIIIIKIIKSIDLVGNL